VKICVIGGAGFIGSHLTRKIIKSNADIEIVIFDNFSSGRFEHIDDILHFKNLTIVRGDVKDIDTLYAAMTGVDEVWHFASNPDIARAASEPEIDFREGTCLTNNVLEAMRRSGAKKLIYASGSGVYGDTGLYHTPENYTPLRPVSTYGASKLAGEMLICAYCHMFGLTARAYRFANVVGPRQTHGVGYDFIRSLRQNTSKLRILGDGTQSKSYIYIDDVLDAIFHTQAYAEKPFDVYNVATDDYITVIEIAQLAAQVLGLAPDSVQFEFTGGSRGWQGDVPIVRFNLKKIHQTGWYARFGCKDALLRSMLAMLQELD
jgi:UDP-glucose 4-epimerase